MWEKSDESDEVEKQNSENDHHPEDEGWRMGGWSSEEHEGQVEEFEAIDKGREECRKGVEDCGLGHI